MPQLKLGQRKGPNLRSTCILSATSVDIRTRGAITTALAVALLAALVVSGVLIAQAPQSSVAGITGRVLDANGQPVRGATVSLGKNGLTQDAIRITAADGSYAFDDLGVGADYELKATHAGLAARVRPAHISESGTKIMADLVVLPAIQFQNILIRCVIHFHQRQHKAD